MEEVEQQMQKPDFIKFYKHLKKAKIVEDLDTSVDSIKGYSAAQRNQNSKKQSLKEKKYSDQLKMKQPKVFKNQADLKRDQENEPNEVTCEDFIIIQHFFKSVCDEESQRISKQDLTLFLLDNFKFCKAYDLNKQTLEFRLQNYQTKDHSFVTSEEFINFILYPKHQIIHNKNIEDKSQVSSEIDQFDGVSQVNEKMEEFLNLVYKELDVSGNGKVNPRRLVQAIRASHNAKDYIYQNIFRVQGIQKDINLEQLLYEFEIYHGIKNTEYIKLDDLMLQVRNYKPLQIPGRDVILSSRQIGGVALNKQYKYEFLQLPSQFYHVLEQNFNRCDKKFGSRQYQLIGRYVNIKHLLTQLQCSNEFQTYLEQQVRKEETNILPIETVNQTLDRMEVESEPFVSFDEVVDFFIVRGRPLKLDIQLRGKQVTKPQVVDVQKKKEYEQRSTTILRYQIEINEMIYGKSFGAKNRINNQEFLVTIPTPLEQRDELKKTIRQKKLERQLHNLKKEEDTAIGYQFKANSVPWYVTEPLLDKINRDKEENRLRIKDEIKKRIQQDQKKPYNFEKDAMAKNQEQYPKQSYQDFTFKARPVPNSSSALLYQQILDEKQQTSMDNVERRKQELMDMSDVPQGFKNMLQRSEEKSLMKNMSPYHKGGCQSDVSFEHVRANQMPDFERLHKNFDEIMQSRKGQFNPTVPEEPNITQNQMKPMDNFFLNEKNQYGNKESRIKEIDRQLKSILKTPQCQAYLTRKYEDSIDQRRRQKSAKAKNNEQEQLDYQNMKKERQKLLPKGIQTKLLGDDRKKILNKELKESVRWKREYNKNMDKKYEQDKKKMIRNVRERPLVMYSANKDIQITSGGGSSSGEQMDSDSSYETNTDNSQYQSN